jgi:hypothetical protein
MIRGRRLHDRERGRPRRAAPTIFMKNRGTFFAEVSLYLQDDGSTRNAADQERSG